MEQQWWPIRQRRRRVANELGNVEHCPRDKPNKAHVYYYQLYITIKMHNTQSFAGRVGIFFVQMGFIHSRPEFGESNVISNTII